MAYRDVLKRNAHRRLFDTSNSKSGRRSPFCRPSTIIVLPAIQPLRRRKLTLAFAGSQDRHRFPSNPR